VQLSVISFESGSSSARKIVTYINLLRTTADIGFFAQAPCVFGTRYQQQIELVDPQITEME
jgi:hypothetical protein